MHAASFFRWYHNRALSFIFSRYAGSALYFRFLQAADTELTDARNCSSSAYLRHL